MSIIGFIVMLNMAVSIIGFTVMLNMAVIIIGFTVMLNMVVSIIGFMVKLNTAVRIIGFMSMLNTVENNASFKVISPLRQGSTWTNSDVMRSMIGWRLCDIAHIVPPIRYRPQRNRIVEFPTRLALQHKHNLSQIIYIVLPSTS